MNQTVSPLSQHDQQTLSYCQQLLANNRIIEAKNKLAGLLSLYPLQPPVLELAFSIELRCQNFVQAELHYQTLVDNTDHSKQQQLWLIALLEAKEDHFALLIALEKILDEFGEETQTRFKHGLVAMAAGKILLAEQSFLMVKEHKKVLPHLLLNLGHVYKAKGESDKAISYYREFIVDNPAQCGVGYWSMADIKDFTFTVEDNKKLQSLLANKSVDLGNKALIGFATARGYEQQKRYDLAFAAMRDANRVFEQHRPFRGNLFQTMVNDMISGVSNQKIEAPVSGNFAPIFIVGMPRSGTTLVEQILASHSKVGATDELQYIERIGLTLERSGGYVKQLGHLANDRRQALAEQYTNQVQQYFIEHQVIAIDKNPNNFLHIGLIKTLFPQAKIINVVRNPLDNALSVFKQYFSRGHEYSYSMKGITFYWQGYLALMHHWKKTFGQEIYHLSYESLTNDAEQEIRNLLEYCQLEFESQCLSFYKSDRVVLTPSVSQVKQPINKRSVNSWQHYQPFIQEHMPTFKQIIAQTQALLEQS